MVLSIIGNRSVRLCGRIQWHNVYTKFHPGLSSCSRVDSCGQTDRHGQSYMPLFYAYRANNAYKYLSLMFWIQTCSYSHAKNAVYQTHHHHQWFYSPWPPHTGGFIILLRHSVGLLWTWSARRKGLYLHTTTEHRNTKASIHASSGIRTHDPFNQAAKIHVLFRAANGISCLKNKRYFIN
jgi:hypothetical protein